MKKTFLLLAFLIVATVVSAAKNPDLHTEGNWCDGNYSLVATPVKKAGNWEWKRNGKVLNGETTNTLNLTKYGTGNYEVTFNATDGNLTWTGSYEMSSLPGPKADFGFDFLYAAAAVQFTNMSSNATADITWAWDFGDSTTSTEQNPTHFYKSEGTYVVKLTATDQSGCANTVTFEVTWKYPKN